MYIVNDYSKWNNKLNEQEFPGRTKQTAGFGQRVVGIPIDQKNFKIKVINDKDIIDPAGNITSANWTDIFNWVKAQPKWLPYYPGLNDLKTNFIIYSVKADSDRKQLITFTIEPRTSAPGLPQNIQLVKKEDLSKYVKDQSSVNILTGDSNKASNTILDTTVNTSSAKNINLTKSISFAELKTLGQDHPLFKAIDDAYIRLMKAPSISSLKFFPLLKKELKSGKLGDAAVSFIKGIIAAFNLRDKYDDPLDIITQEVADKISEFKPKDTQITKQNSSKNYYIGLDGNILFEDEQKSGVETKVTGVDAYSADKQFFPSGADIPAFIKAVDSQSTGSSTEIIIPEGGLKLKVGTVDKTLGSIQGLIITKFADKLKDSPLYQKFAGYGPDGKFGNTTKTMIKAISAGFSLPETDGTSITSELLNKLQNEDLNESYLGLLSRLVESFDMEKFDEEAKKFKLGTDTTKNEPVNKSESSSWTNIKTKLENFKPGLVKLSQDGEAYIIKLGNDQIDVYQDLRIVYWEGDTKKWRGTISQDLSSVQLDKQYGGTKIEIGKLVTNPKDIVAKPATTVSKDDDAIASDIWGAAYNGGIGTNESRLKAAILKIKDKDQFNRVSSALKTKSKLGIIDTINDELGDGDIQDIKDISAHLTKLGFKVDDGLSSKVSGAASTESSTFTKMKIN